MRSIKDAFDPRLNSLNFLRLMLAFGVLAWHSITLTGSRLGWRPLQTLLGSGFVDGFFAISGFLIVGSWVRRPDWRRYLRARVLRILPGFWVCLVLTAFVFAPIGAWISGFSMSGAFFRDAAGYVLRNSLLYITQEGIQGTPVGVAEHGIWNGSLWTLWWEFLCYIGVLVLGLTGLLKKNYLIPALFAVSVIGLVLTRSGPLDGYLAHHMARFATMFLAGAVIYTFQHKIPASFWIVTPAAMIVLFSGYLPDYRVIGALPLAYACVTTGALLKVPALRFSNDLSYGTYIYGYPTQQLLVLAGAAQVGVPWFLVLSIAAVLPLAMASWFLIEKPVQKFKAPARKAMVVEGSAPIAAPRVLR